MKSLLVLSLGLSALVCANAQTNVGISVGINQPGVYGQINIGNYPAPRVINQRPVVITQSAYQEPLYLYVPPGHQKHWEKHCHEYNGCNRPVYFVREDWVRERYNEEQRGHENRGQDGRRQESRDGRDGRDGRDHRDGRDGRGDERR